MFTMIGAAERAGSGVDKTRRGWSSQHWRFPIIREQVQPDRVLWVLPMVSLIPEESLTRLKKRLGLKFTKFSQSEIQALVTADIEGYVDNARMRQMTNKHAADITKILQDLVSQGALIQDGQGRWTRYGLPSAPSSIHMDGGSVHMEELSSMDREAFLAIAEPARRNRRLPPNEMEQVILRLCRNAWLTRRQLAELLDRSPDGLRSRFLTQMVAHGLLRLRYPDKPNRADQAYTG